MVSTPVYYPFMRAVEACEQRRLVKNELKRTGMHYTFDFEAMEQQIVQQGVTLYILCNPHNPVGRVWTKEELLRIGTICQEHQVLVFSDEIHFDFIWSGEHHVFQEVDPAFREFTMTATAPSKTFNLAGLQQSNIFIPNEKIRCV